MKKSTFSRYIPKPAQFLEKPMSQFTSGRIKRLYDGYEAFCQEIGKLLDGTPSSKNKTSAELFDELDHLWQAESFEEHVQQLLTVLSTFYRAGFVVQTHSSHCSVRSYFVEGTPVLLNSMLQKDFVRFTPDEPLEEALKPKRVAAPPILSTLGLPELNFDEKPEAFHFLISPEKQLSLLVICDNQEPELHEMLLKTQALIQRRFYD